MERFEPAGPVSGDDDTCSVVDAALTALAARRGLWMGDDRVMVHLVASLIDQARRCLPELVGELLAEGDCSWAEIAVLLGVREEQARVRFDPASPQADGRWLLNL